MNKNLCMKKVAHMCIEEDLPLFPPFSFSLHTQINLTSFTEERKMGLPLNGLLSTAKTLRYERKDHWRISLGCDVLDECLEVSSME